MESFMEKYDEKIMGTLTGFDRLVFRGTLRPLAVVCGMMDFLYRSGVWLKDFGDYVQTTSQKLKEASLAAALRTQRPVIYLRSSQIRKETVAREIAKADGIEKGLIAVLTCVEPCMSYEIYRDRQAQKLDLRAVQRKCLHLYHYWIDPVFGFMHARIQTWFPFTIQVCLNGREFLARQMDQAGLAYQRRENGFSWIDDFPRAQRLMDKLLKVSWPRQLQRIARQLNPAHASIFKHYNVDYYWSTHQSEWATDIAFRSVSALSEIYPLLVRGAMTTFSSEDVMRFLGKKLHGNFKGEVVSDYKKRPEGVRVKHSYNTNSVKLYDKQGRILRVETTLNQVRDFKVYRPAPEEPGGAWGWQRMRKGVADLHRRAELSNSSNQRYLEALAGLDTHKPLREVVKTICRGKTWKKQKVRALRPWSVEDRELLEAISRGEFALNGFRNRDIASQLWGQPLRDRDPQKKRTAKVTYRLRLLRAHGIIKKIPHTSRYLLTRKGRQFTTALIATQNITLEQINKIVA